VIGLSRFRQSLTGSYRAPGDLAEHPLSLELRGLRSSLIPGLHGQIQVEGEIDAKGLAGRQPVQGAVELQRLFPFAASYSLVFRADDGRELRLVGQRKPAWPELLYSASRVSGRVVDSEGREVAKLELRLDFRREISRWVQG
jgi:hypothetical protein